MSLEGLSLNEVERVKALRELSILDTLPEQTYDNLVVLAAQICETPIAAISFVDNDRTWSKSMIGLREGSRNCPRDYSFCAQAILSDEPVFEITDATLDPYFADTPLVKEEPRIAFYAAALLKTQSGHNVGTICVLDRVPRRLTPVQMESLRLLGDQVLALLEHRAQLTASRAEISRLFEASLSKSEAYVHATLNSVDAGFFGIDLSGSITICNEASLNLLRYRSSSDVVDKKFEDIVRPFVADETRAAEAENPVLAAAKSGTRLHGEGYFSFVDGSSIPLEYWVSPIVLNEQLQGAVVCFMDVTARKATETRLAHERHLLEQARFAAENANLAKSQFLANMSHEIRTPLGAILGFAEILSGEDSPPAERAHLFARIHANGVQLTSLIDDLLDLTKVEANQIELEMIPVDLFALLTELRDVFVLKAVSKKIDFEMSIEGALPKMIVTDPTRLRQVLTNVIGNAIKFAPIGGRVRVSAAGQVADARARCAVRVTDNGPGLTEKQRQTLFQPFAQGDVSVTRKYGGTGLGLFVSRRLARLLEGDVTVESSVVGEGSVFAVSFAAAMTEDSTQFSDLSSALVSRTGASGDAKILAGIQILVVDDSSDNRELIRNYLVRAGASVHFANDGREGVERAIGGNFDVVLMDIQMPILDGNSAMRELRSRGYTKPVVALTAHAMVEERTISLSCGFREYLTKPIARDHLVSTIQALARPRLSLTKF